MRIDKKFLVFLFSVVGLCISSTQAAGFPVCPDIDLENDTQLEACLDFCDENPSHYACSWSCGNGSTKCDVPKPDCSDPTSPGCRLFCMTNPQDSSCDYFCTVQPDMCDGLSDECSAFITSDDCDGVENCQSLKTPDSMKCRDDAYLGCDLKYNVESCRSIGSQSLCDSSPGCLSNIVLGEGGNGSVTEIFIGCDVRERHDASICKNLNQNSCGSNSICEATIGRSCELVSGGDFVQCVTSDLQYDVCLLDPFDSSCEWDETQCSKYPEYWKCKPSCIENPEGCSGMPDYCSVDPTRCEEDFVPLCAYGLSENREDCVDFCLDNPSHWGCNWDCLYGGDGACDEDPYLDCHASPDQEGCPDYCATNPLHPKCDYICTVTGVCEDAKMDDFGCSEDLYDRSCNNVCQIGALSEAQLSIGCHESCQSDPFNSSCAPAGVLSQGIGVFAQPYCTLKSDTNCIKKDQRYCELYPQDKYCSSLCEIDPLNDNCPHFCEVYPLDPSCCTLDFETGICTQLSLDQSHPDILEPHLGQAEFCALDGMSFLGVCNQGDVSVEKSYCAVIREDSGLDVTDYGVCDDVYDTNVVFGMCDFVASDISDCLGHTISLEHEGFSDYFGIQYQGHCAGRENCIEDSIRQTYKASEDPIYLSFLSQEPLGIGVQSGINFTDPSSVYISHLIIRDKKTLDEELFINPGIVHKADQIYFQWDINQHRWAGTEKKIFSQVGVYEFVLGICDKAGNCEYTPQNTIEIVPGDISMDVFQSSVLLNCTDSLSKLYADGGKNPGCEIMFSLQDRFGNPVVGSDARGVYRAGVIGRDDFYNLEQRSDPAAYLSGLRFRNHIDKTISVDTKWQSVDDDGGTKVELVSFLPTAETVILENVCGDGRSFYALKEPKDMLVPLEIQALGYNPDGSRRPYGFFERIEAQVPVHFDVPFLGGVSLSGDFANPLPDTIHPQSNGILPVFIHGDIHGAKNDFEKFQVSVDGFSSLRGFKDKDFADPEVDKTYDFDDSKVRHPDKTKLIPVPGRGRGDKGFSFSSLITYTVPASISGVGTPIEVSYPAMAFGYPRGCGVALTDLDGVMGSLEIPELEERNADVEGRFLAKNENVFIDEDADLTEMYLEKFDNTRIRSDLMESVRSLTTGVDPANSHVDKVVVLRANDLEAFEDGGITYYKGVTVVLADEAQEKMELTGRHTIIIEDGELMIGDDLVYLDNAQDSWGFVLFNSHYDAPPFDASTGLYSINRNDGDLTNDLYGNIFVANTVKQMVGTYHADGVFTSTIEDPISIASGANVLDILDTSINRSPRPNPDHLFNQLVLTGMLNSNNTFGGSMFEEKMVDPWGRYVYHSSVGDMYAKIFDLHFVRQFLYSAVDPDEVEGYCSKVDGADDRSLDDGCYENGHPFVIHVDNKVTTSPPPGFRNNSGYSVSQ